MVPAPSSLPEVTNMTSLSLESKKQYILQFLNEYRPLECACCSQVFGYQHKITDALYCVECPHTGSVSHQGPPSGSQLMTIAPKLDVNVKAAAAAAVSKSVAVPVSQSEVNVQEVPKAKSPVYGSDHVDSVPPKPVVPLKMASNAAKPVEPVKMASTAAKLVEPVKMASTAAKVVSPFPKPSVVTPAPKQVAPLKTAPPARKRHMWADMKYSPNLFLPNANVRVLYNWTQTKYNVAAEADDEAMGNLTDKLKVYAETVKPMTEPPIENEIVIGEYDGGYYRGRVTSIKGDECEVTFIDYGDRKVCKYSEVFPVNDELMKVPVYGFIVQLKLPVPADADFKLSEGLEQSVFEDLFILDLIKKGAAPVPGQVEQLEARLWDIEKENTVNEKITAEMTATRGITSSAADLGEISYFMENQFFREVKALVEEEKSTHVNYVFKLDNSDYLYKIQDLPLVKLSLVKDIVEVQIVQLNSLASIIAVPVGEPFDKMRNEFNKQIGDWMQSRDLYQLSDLQQDFIPEHDQMCIVKWPTWRNLNCHMHKTHGLKWQREFIEQQERLSLTKKDFSAHAGKWFRAACKSNIDASKYVNHQESIDDIVFEMFLVDIGKTTLIPATEVYRIPHRFAYAVQRSMFLSLFLNNTDQYSDNEDEKWYYLLLPGMKVKIKILWMFDEINIVKLVNPSEKDFDRHFLKPLVQQCINRKKQDQRSLALNQKIRKLSKGMKNEYRNKIHDEIKAEEEQEEKRKPFLDEYAAIGRLHPDLIFELCLPH